jgi:hypothetical protein
MIKKKNEKNKTSHKNRQTGRIQKLRTETFYLRIRQAWTEGSRCPAVETERPKSAQQGPLAQGSDQEWKVEGKECVR